MSRAIDLDLLLYGEEFFSDDGLTIPHPRMHKRGFGTRTFGGGGGRGRCTDSGLHRRRPAPRIVGRGTGRREAILDMFLRLLIFGLLLYVAIRVGFPVLSADQALPFSREFPVCLPRSRL